MEVKRTFDLLANLKQNINKDDILCAKRNKEWVKFSVNEYSEQARLFSYGLLAKGFTKGDKIVTVSNNRPEWNFVDMGMSMIGVVHVPVYPTISDEEYKYILEHSDAKMLIVSDIILYNRLSEVAKDIESIKEIYTFNDIKDASNWSEITSLGEQERIRWKDEFKTIRDGISEDELVSIIYTSGTTGNPKGVMLSHKNFMSNMKDAIPRYPLSAEDNILSFLPLCHVYERMINYLFQANGCSIYYAENLGTIAQNLVEIKATAFVTVPRVIERIYDKLVSKGNDLSGIKKTLFFWAMKLGERYRTNGKNYPLYAAKLKIARKLIFSKWQKAFGGNLRLVVSGGAALQPRLSRLFFAAGIPLMEGYGLTETAPVIASNHIAEPDNLMIGTVGTVFDSVDIRIEEDGEILAKGPNIMMGYYKDEKTTAEVINKDGWFHTGDIGTLVKGRFLKITDRKKEMFKLSSGKYIAPQSIENLLKESDFIEQAIIVGESEKFAGAILSPNFNHLHLWAHDHKIHFRDNQELINNEKVLAIFRKEVMRFNKLIGKHEEVKRFRLVHEAWTSASGELSPTLKLRRRIIYRKYADVLREMYAYGENEENKGSIKFG
ncbi:long-chain fatty acid--CoA ligase [Carboxylicivirga sp. M1479]|uniref:AMP-dependent synthetase/ligase n=1 Tax=Carboxylicivirga sp. M1479 TaxID=2594476 RepID=UPI00117775E1|nr:AMP-dependent synthetase/ligase [Carboxylicivirga sp. M1479]TRX72459.1 long-chain fatty acid--CoA ligase [Carboxylicivirga sp. M1479]